MEGSPVSPSGLRSLARSALVISDTDLLAQCEVRELPGQVLLLHHLTGIEVATERRRSTERSVLLALVKLRNAFYDLNRPRKRREPGWPSEASERLAG